MSRFGVLVTLALVAGCLGVKNDPKAPPSYSSKLTPADLDAKVKLLEMTVDEIIAPLDKLTKLTDRTIGMLIPKQLHEVPFKDVVIPSKLIDDSTQRQVEKIIGAFNTKPGVDMQPSEAITASWWRGKRIPPGSYFIVHKNQVPFIASTSQAKLAKRLNFDPNNEIAVVRGPGNKDFHDIDAVHIDAFGSHIINVPNGHYCKGEVGTSSEPRLYGPGPHVVHDPTLKLDDLVVPTLEQYIEHRSIHIIRVPPGKFAKVSVGTKYGLLPSRAEPYTFNDPLFKYDGLVNVKDDLITHGNLNIIRVPNGFLAKAWIGVKPVLLPSQLEPYIFVDPNFRCSERFVCQKDMIHIKHDNLHILNVPSGKVAKAWFHNDAMLLEHRTEAYAFDSPYFSYNELVNADKPVIIHGSIKRILPATGQVAVCFDAGKLFLVYPSNDGTAFIRDSQLFTFEGFLNINIATVVFPSERVRKQRRSENRNATPDQINLQKATTRDGLKVGFKLTMTYTVAKPELLLSKLHMNEIDTYIENVVSMDLSHAMQTLTSREFLSFYTANKKPPAYDGGDDSLHTAPLAGGGEREVKAATFIGHIKDDVMGDLQEIGITLLHLNIESPKALDEATAKSMEEQSLLLARAKAQESVLETQFKIEKQKAMQEAEVRRIKQERDNQNLVSAAEAERKAAELKAQVVIIEAEAKTKAYDMLYKNTQLFQMEYAKLQAGALERADVHIMVAPEKMHYGLGSLLLPHPLQDGVMNNLATNDPSKHAAGQPKQAAGQPKQAAGHEPTAPASERSSDA
ncbi:SPFH domain / Band 7 family [Plasmodiophora brassicae]